MGELKTGMVKGNPARGCDRISACMDLKAAVAVAHRLPGLLELVKTYQMMDTASRLTILGLAVLTRHLPLEQKSLALAALDEDSKRRTKLKQALDGLLAADDAAEKRVDAALTEAERARTGAGLAALGATDVVVSLN